MSPSPSTTTKPRRAKSPRSRGRAATAEIDAESSTSAIVLLDQRRLQRALWADYHTEQKRHEKAARDLHRHEEIDTPAYEKWLNKTFPILLTELRNLQEQITTKGSQIRFVRAMAAHTGRSAKRLWHEFKVDQLRGTTGERDPASEDAKKSGRGPDPDADFFADREDDEPPYRGRGQSAAHRQRTIPPPARSVEARDIYRRLVQRLHPDRGGDWTAARKRLWHEVQQAWAKGDADWLSRLEVELESAADLARLGLHERDPLSENSPLSRLQRAIAELHAARRDTERKLREYRTTPPWRFSLATKKRDILERRTERTLRHDLMLLQRQLAHLDKTIRGWEEPTLGRSKPRYTPPGW